MDGFTGHVHFAELFGTRVRYTGASLPYQIAGIITSALAPLIST